MPGVSGAGLASASCWRWRAPHSWDIYAFLLHFWRTTEYFFSR